ncbi:hypothetical protein [Tessaracoccus sp. MC1756]|uniref:hypothetical protein n=1 Tax=Tessaracoccus sp. MC1756 TaxID=2760311 RepID=UPI00160159E3|nr:hypothetical protein [Tessaracoccus sp. MC1756]MBB1510801.1 hypothetical protein [Tessaracoccus sp. MC1756]
MSDTLVMVLSAVLAIGVLAGSLWTIWRVTRRTPTRNTALSQVLCCVAGTALLGVVLPAVLKGIMDPVPVWTVYVVLTAVGAVLLTWRWDALARGRKGLPGLLISSASLAVVLAVAGLAVT